MDGDEFYRFLRTEDAKGRYFIQLTNDGDTDCDVIHMEVSKPEYLAWRADYDRKQYYRKRNLRHDSKCRKNSKNPDRDQDRKQLLQVISQLSDIARNM